MWICVKCGRKAPEILHQSSGQMVLTGPCQCGGYVYRPAK